MFLSVTFNGHIIICLSVIFLSLEFYFYLFPQDVECLIKLNHTN
jgi:hypothetical protein